MYRILSHQTTARTPAINVCKSGLRLIRATIIEETFLRKTRTRLFSLFPVLSQVLLPWSAGNIVSVWSAGVFMMFRHPATFLNGTSSKRALVNSLCVHQWPFLWWQGYISSSFTSLRLLVLGSQPLEGRHWDWRGVRNQWEWRQECFLSSLRVFQLLCRDKWEICHFLLTLLPSKLSRICG